MLGGENGADDGGAQVRAAGDRRRVAVLRFAVGIQRAFHRDQSEIARQLVERRLPGQRVLHVIDILVDRYLRLLQLDLLLQLRRDLRQRRRAAGHRHW